MKYTLVTSLLIALILVSVRSDEDDSEDFLSDEDCECDRMLFPVCGSDGHTYPNICVMECDNKEKTIKVTKVKDGRC